MKKILDSQYITLTNEDLEALNNGDTVEIICGERIKRYLTTKSLSEIKEDKLKEQYEIKLAKLRGE